MKEPFQVFTTTNSKETAAEIAEELVDKRLAGCAQIIGPISSTCWWEGTLETEEEWLCFIKSKKSLYSELEKNDPRSTPFRNTRNNRCPHS